MNTTLLKDLIDLGGAFEQAFPDPTRQTRANFLAWASANEPGPAVTDTGYRYYSADVPVLQTRLTHLVTKLYRYFRVYVKKAFETAPLLAFDDFIALAYLAGRGSMFKTDLVAAIVNEKASGMLVIKRLIDSGFVAQTDDNADKRTRLLTLTESGWATLRAFQPAMNEATALFKGDLTEAEQRGLSTLMDRLDAFHSPIYQAHLNHRDGPLSERRTIQ